MNHHTTINNSLASNEHRFIPEAELRQVNTGNTQEVWIATLGSDPVLVWAKVQPLGDMLPGSTQWVAHYPRLTVAVNELMGPEVVKRVLDGLGISDSGEGWLPGTATADCH